MAPSVALQVTPSSLLNAAATAAARRLRLASSAARSAAHCACEGSPGAGGLTMHDIAIWPIELGQRLMLEIWGRRGRQGAGGGG